MKINYNLDEAKQRVIKLIKDQACDFCTDMFMEIKAAATKDDIDSVESFVQTIRQVESMSEQQIRAINGKAGNVTDILNYTANDESVGNVLYDCHDLVLKAIFQVEFEEQFNTEC